MLDKLIGGHGFGHKEHRSSGFGFQEHKEFASHEESQGGFFDRQNNFGHMRLPANHGRPPMARMPVCDEEDSDSDVEEFFDSSRNHHNNNHHQHPPHHNGKMGNGWQGGHGMQHHGGGHGMQHHGGGHGMEHHGGGHGMQHHGGHGMQHHGGHGMQHHGGHEMQHHGGMKHQNKLMAPQVPPHHVFMIPGHGSGNGHAMVVKENWRVSNSSSTHHKAGWGSKGL